MGRFLLIVFVSFGFLSAMLGRTHSRGSSAEKEFYAKASADQKDAYEEAQRAGEPTVTTIDGAIELSREGDGHFYADVRINGAPVHMLVDTGASAIALSRDDARTAGIATSVGMNNVVGEGADGDVYGEYVKIDRMELGPKTVEGLDGVVLNSGTQSLLGQSFLAKFDSVEIHGDKMVLN
ncbi:MAG TPA: TIGR02281 family clan AA aspartic protease [Sphingomicrobium sp.]|nr:TIGR02281 family clan AA aspartic protease [Sphingomicrobium sp.]